MKFRGRRKDTGEWVVGYLMRHDWGTTIAQEEPSIRNTDKNKFVYYEVHPSSLAMSIGITDKNGKMIFGSFEVDGVMSKGGDKCEHGKVVFFDGSFCLDSGNTNQSPTPIKQDRCRHWEIIGDQWEVEENG